MEEEMDDQMAGKKDMWQGKMNEEDLETYGMLMFVTPLIDQISRNQTLHF